MNAELKEKIDSLINQNPVVLFMKGTKEQPQCGFSKRVVDVLKIFVSDFICVDVIADPNIREGIKIYSSWPTIPQLYVKGEFIGGCDIVLDLYEKGDLPRILDVPVASDLPDLTMTNEAMAAFSDANPQRGEGEYFRLSISADFDHSLSFDFRHEDDFIVEFGEVEILIDRITAARADGLRINFENDGLESGFSFDNPNEPAPVIELPVEEFKEWRDQGKPVVLFDVRPRWEWEKAHIDFALLLEEVPQAKLTEISKDQPIVFMCHHGGRSRRAAESFRMRGYNKIYNLTGGIDAWSRKIDRNVPVYSK